MKTVGELAGLAIIGEGSGDRLGRVQDVFFNPAQGGQITAFVVNPGGVFGKHQILPRLLVRSLGTDAVLIETGHVLEELSKEPAADGSLSVNSLHNRPILDDTGKMLGKLDDVLVDESNLAVVGLLLNTGLIDAVLHGKPRIPLSVVGAFGADSIIVASSYDVHAAEKQR